jgi:phage recombination protein Bet
MSTALSKAEQNALTVSYDVLGTHVELDLQFVKSYLVRGNPEKITDQEIVFFMNTCKMQKLNPLVAGEVYCIKFGNEPAQMVVGKGAYLRRAFEHPDYLCKEDGIVVVRGSDILQKEGCCLYPGETLLGGWCRVHFIRNGKERTAFKEVQLAEYDKGQANWKSKPATMINKVAISQCVREAFPKDYEGLYSEEEMIASGAIPANYTIIPETGEVIEDDPTITQEQRQTMFKIAQSAFGAEEGNNLLKRLLKEEGYESTHELPTSVFNKVVNRIMELKAQKEADDAENGEQGEEANTSDDQ